MARSKVAQGQTRSKSEEKAAEAAWAEERKHLEAIKARLVPVTLGRLCRAIGVNVKPERFGSTALMSLAIQLEGIESIAEQDNAGLYDRWCCVENIVDRMRLAANVAAWIDGGMVAEQLPEVEP